MKNTGKCPKCGTDNILSFQSHSDFNLIRLGLFSGPVLLRRFVCGQCGFVESWVENSEDLNSLREKFRKDSVSD